MAYGSLVFYNLSGGDSIEIAWLGDEDSIDEELVEDLFESEGRTSFNNGDLCFKGRRKEAIEVLYSLEWDFDFMGDEEELKAIMYVGKDRLSYRIYDAPNEYISEPIMIYSCSKVGFTK